MPATPSPAIRGRLGGHVSWANTVDRSARTAPARSSGPAAIEYHLARLGPQFASATEAQRVAAAEAARKAYFVGIAMKSAASRRAKRGAA